MMNPVLRREAITSLRGWKNFAVVMFYIGIILFGAGLFFFSTVYNSYDYSFDPQAMTFLYVFLASIQMALVVISVPAFAAGSISGEREKQTLDLLLVTKLSPLSIVVGKMLASMAFVLLLVVSTLPVFALVFYFGSIHIGSLLLMMAFAVTTAFMLAGISVFFSCVYKRTVISIMLVYIITGILCIGTLIWAYMPYIVMGYGYSGSSMELELLKIIPNPGMGFASLMGGQLGVDVVGGMFSDIMRWQEYDEVNTMTQWVIDHLWLVHMTFQVVVGGVFVLLAASKINPIGKKSNRRK
ncbi:ABC transporter permease [Chakrabartyella piscis]|uniref:ABC transporter permease n=1 Tax=Chakrabartyella piscis TaxID=2918914 RepID=UPI0029584DAD|nr:ABC transporter permease subunit [Chakrabartyella piscis]